MRSSTTSASASAARTHCQHFHGAAGQSMISVGRWEESDLGLCTFVLHFLFEVRISFDTNDFFLKKAWVPALGASQLLMAMAMVRMTMQSPTMIEHDESAH